MPTPRTPLSTLSMIRARPSTVSSSVHRRSAQSMKRAPRADCPAQSAPVNSSPS